MSIVCYRRQFFQIVLLNVGAAPTGAALSISLIFFLNSGSTPLLVVSVKCTLVPPTQNEHLSIHREQGEYIYSFFHRISVSDFPLTKPCIDFGNFELISFSCSIKWQSSVFNPISHRVCTYTEMFCYIFEVYPFFGYRF